MKIIVLVHQLTQNCKQFQQYQFNNNKSVHWSRLNKCRLFYFIRAVSS